MNRRLLLICLLAASSILLQQRTLNQAERSAEVQDQERGQARARTSAQTAAARPTAKALTAVMGTVRGATLPVAGGHVVASLTLDANTADTRLRSVGSEVLYVSRYTGRARLAVPPETTPNEFARFLDASGMTVGAIPDPLCAATGFDGPDKTAALYPLQWHHDATETHKLWEKTEIDSYGDQAVIAVLDTGIGHDRGLGHHIVSDLDAVTFRAPYNALNGSADAADDHQHGTHIAAVIAGHGLAPGTSYGRDLMPVKVLDANKRGTESSLVDGIHHAIENGATVLNMSLSFPRAYLPGPELAAAIARADDEDVSMVASAGNDGEPWVSYPAAFPAVIAVGAARMDRHDNHYHFVRAEYSNYGPGLDVMAPGGDIHRDANQDGYPDGILAASFPLNNPDGPDTYYFVSGTSAAAAQISGVVAAMRDRGAPANGVRWALHEARVKMEENEDDTASHEKQDKYDPRVGSGMVDGEKAYEKWDEEPPEHFGLGVSVVLTDAGNGQRRGVAVVQALDPDHEPLKDAQVWISWLGDAHGYGHCVTGEDGMCAVYSDPVPDGTVIGANAHGLRHKEDHGMIRAVPVTRFEARAYRLLGTLGTGLASSSLVLDYNTTALNWFGAWTNEPVLETVTLKNTGTGLASSSIVLSIERVAFLDSPMAGSFTVFKTGGTGLASSSIVLDHNFYNLLAPGALDTDVATVWGFPMGTGLASSSIVIDQTSFSWDAFMSTYNNPGVLYFNAGTGLASSSLILDVGMWNPSLFFGTPGVQETYSGLGTGLASSSFVFDYNLSTLDWLGFETGGWDLGGTGLASSSLILDDGYMNMLTLDTWSQWYGYGLSDEVVGAGVGWAPLN